MAECRTLPMWRKLNTMLRGKGTPPLQGMARRVSRCRKQARQPEGLAARPHF